MRSLRARVHAGRLLLDEPTTLPDGTVLNLVVDDEGDDFDEATRLAVDSALRAADASARSGQLSPAAVIIARLRDRRG
jgi:hypothetical protein